MKVLLTGATGFLGYHIARACFAAGHELLCLRRQSSRSPFTPEEEKSIRWFMLDEADVDSLVAEFAPEILVHAAWGGLSHQERNDEKIQLQNVALMDKILKMYPYQQLIVLGSMEEYGYPGTVVTEESPVSPFSAYTESKLRCLNILRDYVNLRDVEWQWIRVFSIFGLHQQKDWLLPSLIEQCLSDVEVIHTTKGEQTYAYLWAEDFGRAVVSVFGAIGCSGIYNLGSQKPIHLYQVFERIRKETGYRRDFMKDLPYRGNGNLIVLGDSSKFIKQFGAYETVLFEEGLAIMVENLKGKRKNGA